MTGRARLCAGALASQTIANVGLNVAAFSANLGLAVLLSRLLGSSGFGAYAFAVAFATILGIPGLLGLPSIVVREIARHRVGGAWGLVRGIIRRTNQAALAASVVVSTGAALVVWIAGWPAGHLRQPTFLGLALVPLLAIVSLRQSAMQGFGRVVLGRTPEQLVAPALLLVIVAVAEWGAGVDLTASWAVAATVAALCISASTGGALLRRTLPPEVRQAEPQYANREWTRAALPLLVSGGIGAVNTQLATVLIGSLRSAREVGLFNVANRAAAFVAFFLLAAIPTLMPRIAELYERGEHEVLQRLLTNAARAVSLVSLPVAVLLAVFPGPILRVFGPDFAAASTPLRILCLAQIVNVLTGFGGTILIMVGRGGLATAGVAVGAAVNLALSPLLISNYGATGAAVGSGIGLAVSNLVIVALLWSRQGIYSPAIRLLRTAA
jgi:O-antigen/teichoic acid export membrane protein